MPVLTHVEVVNLHNPGEANPPTRAHVHGHLFPFQERIVAHLTGQTNAVLSASSGLGTMETAIATANTHLAASTERVVVLTQSALAHNWAHELKKTKRDADVLLINNSPGARWRTYATTPAKWIIVCYSFLDHDVEALTPLMATSLLIIDSATQVKNPEAARTIATKRLSEAAARRLTVLSTCNRYKPDQWSHLFRLGLDPLGTARRETETASAATWRYRPEYSMLSVTRND
jgi:hypothetical protein